MKTFNDFFSVTKPPVDDRQLNKMALEMGITIPSCLRNFYKLSNGCHSNQIHDIVYTIYYNNNPLGSFMYIYSIETVKSVFNDFKLCEKDGLGDFGTNRFVPFSDIGRAFICIGHTGEDLGKIFWLDTGNPINETDFETFKLADSLEKFFEGLRPSE